MRTYDVFVPFGMPKNAADEAVGVSGFAIAFEDVDINDGSPVQVLSCLCHQIRQDRIGVDILK